MTKDVITAKAGINIDQAKEILHNKRIEKLPVVDDKKHIVGLITSKDILKMEQYPYASKDRKGRLLVGAQLASKETIWSAQSAARGWGRHYCSRYCTWPQ